MLRTDDNVWITWEIQRRNRSMSSRLGVALHELTTRKKGLLRYVELIIRTFSLVAREKPARVFVQNPSIVLSMLMVCLKPVFRFILIVDEHNSGIYPLEGHSIFLNVFARIIVRFSDIVIVTNQVLADVCRRWGGNPVVMPDPLPVLEYSGKEKSNFQPVKTHFFPFTVLFICTWAADEPYEEVIESATKLGHQDVELRVTGKYPDRFEQGVSPKVKLLGFLSEEDYLRELLSCSAVLVLTSRENCLNCGAYEAVSAGKPGVLSDTEVLRNYFHQGFVFTTNSSEDIARKIIDVRNRAESLKKQVKFLKQELIIKDHAAAKDLATAIGNL
jgi:glycosyltransferase involved in cell wall biosynthesis